MTARRLTAWVAVTMVFACGIKMATTTLAAPDELVEEPIPGLMLAKLASSQAMVAGLVTKDFEQIKRGAKDMIRICDASEWESRQDDVYAHHRQELRRHAIKLSQLAEEQNLDGAAFVYMHTVSTCINCHQHCRDVLRIADRPIPKSGVIRIPVAEDDLQWQSGGNVRR